MKWGSCYEKKILQLHGPLLCISTVLWCGRTFFFWNQGSRSVRNQVASLRAAEPASTVLVLNGREGNGCFRVGGGRCPFLKVNKKLCPLELYWDLLGEIVLCEWLSVWEFVACRDDTGDMEVGAPCGGRVSLKGPLLCLARAALVSDRQRALREPPVLLCECRETPLWAAGEVWVPLREQGVDPGLQGMSCAFAGQQLLRLELSVQLLEELPTEVRVVPDSVPRWTVCPCTVLSITWRWKLCVDQEAPSPWRFCGSGWWSQRTPSPSHRCALRMTTALVRGEVVYASQSDPRGHLPQRDIPPASCATRRAWASALLVAKAPHPTGPVTRSVMIPWEGRCLIPESWHYLWEQRGVFLTHGHAAGQRGPELVGQAGSESQNLLLSQGRREVYKEVGLGLTVPVRDI